MGCNYSTTGYSISEYQYRLETPVDTNTVPTTTEGVPQPDPIQYVPDVAERLRITEQAVRWLVYTKQLPTPIRLGNRMAWKASQIEAYLDAKFAQAEAQTNPTPAA